MSMSRDIQNYMKEKRMHTKEGHRKIVARMRTKLIIDRLFGWEEEGYHQKKIRSNSPSPLRKTRSYSGSYNSMYDLEREGGEGFRYRKRKFQVDNNEGNKNKGRSSKRGKKFQEEKFLEDYGTGRKKNGDDGGKRRKNFIKKNIVGVGEKKRDTFEFLSSYKKEKEEMNLSSGDDGKNQKDGLGNTGRSSSGEEKKKRVVLIKRRERKRKINVKDDDDDEIDQNGEKFGNEMKKNRKEISLGMEKGDDDDDYEEDFDEDLAISLRENEIEYSGEESEEDQGESSEEELQEISLIDDPHSSVLLEEVEYDDLNDEKLLDHRINGRNSRSGIKKKKASNKKAKQRKRGKKKHNNKETLRGESFRRYKGSLQENKNYHKKNGNKAKRKVKKNVSDQEKFISVMAKIKKMNRKEREEMLNLQNVTPPKKTDRLHDFSGNGYESFNFRTPEKNEMIRKNGDGENEDGMTVGLEVVCGKEVFQFQMTPENKNRLKERLSPEKRRSEPQIRRVRRQVGKKAITPIGRTRKIDNKRKKIEPLTEEPKEKIKIEKLNIEKINIEKKKKQMRLKLMEKMRNKRNKKIQKNNKKENFSNDTNEKETLNASPIALDNLETFEVNENENLPSKAREEKVDLDSVNDNNESFEIKREKEDIDRVDAFSGGYVENVMERMKKIREKLQKKLL